MYVIMTLGSLYVLKPVIPVSQVSQVMISEKDDQGECVTWLREINLSKQAISRSLHNHSSAKHIHVHTCIHVPLQSNREGELLQ